MLTAHSADTLTLGGAEEESVRAFLRSRGLGDVSRRAGRRLVATVTADPASVRDLLRSAGVADDVRLDPLYRTGSAAPVTELPGSGPPTMAWEPLPPGLRRPVIALLDSAVLDHPWLPKTPGEDPFLLRASDPTLAEPWSPPALTSGDGHATFAAGLIRAGAPAARVLCVPVVGADRLAAESTVVAALDWLHRHRAAGNPVDVVCLSFGRALPADDSLPVGHSLEDSDLGGLEDLESAVLRLTGAGVRLVAPAGDDHRDTPVYPAAFSQVTAVGSGIGAYHAAFSNHGDWVDRYREGIDLRSSLPPDRWAAWSGTSLSAATFAADVARPHVI
jgi:hypothetical protein